MAKTKEDIVHELENVLSDTDYCETATTADGDLVLHLSDGSVWVAALVQIKNAQTKRSGCGGCGEEVDLYNGLCGDCHKYRESANA